VRLGCFAKTITGRRWIAFVWGDSSVASVALMAVVLINLLSLIYAANVFVQFPFLTVLKVFCSFQAILFFFATLLLRSRTGTPLQISPQNVGAALLVVIFLVYLFASQALSRLPLYVKTFPVLEAEKWLLWHQDTAFHVSLIKSILSFGYPSIAQHGHPLAAYHALSHYVDAAILLATGVDPFDSYGLFVHFKIVLFLSAALLMIGRLTRDHGLAILLLSVGFLLPALIGTWHGVLSHGLWVPSFLLMLAMPSVVSGLYDQPTLSNGQIFGLVLLIVLLALGKVSTGFMFACFTGLWVFIKAPLSLRTLLMGSAVLAFFYGYGQLFIGRLNQIDTPVDLTGLGVGGLVSYFSPAISGAGTWISQLLMLWGGMALLCLACPARRNFQVLLAATLSMLCLWFVSATSPALSANDIGYFQYGLSSVLLIVFYALALRSWVLLRTRLAAPLGERGVRLSGIAVISALALLSSHLKLSGHNAFNLDAYSVSATASFIREGAFVQINKRLPVEQRFHISQPYAQKRHRMELLQQGSYLLTFRRYLDWYMRQRSVSPEQSALFIPRSVYEGEMTRLRGMPWANGMLMYALLGVPLVHGVPDGARGYGFAGYQADAGRLEAGDFSLARACQASGAREIWLVNQLRPPRAEPMDCTARDAEVH
jgi:hypothetical protein